MGQTRHTETFNVVDGEAIRTLNTEVKDVETNDWVVMDKKSQNLGNVTDVISMVKSEKSDAIERYNKIITDLGGNI